MFAFLMETSFKVEINFVIGKLLLLTLMSSNFDESSQPLFACSKLIKSLEQGVKLSQQQRHQNVFFMLVSA